MMRSVASHAIQPVKKAMKGPEKSPLSTEPMNALSMLLNAAAERVMVQDIFSCDLIFCNGDEWSVSLDVHAVGY